MDVTELLDGLNPAQREAVAAEPGNALVLAGAGSGKTRVLVHRIAWLIRAEGFSPQSLLAVTFTNKAAKEMRGRIESMLGLSTHGFWVGTFHGLAHRLLKAHWREAGLQQNFQILDSDDQLRLVKRIVKELGLDDGRWPPKQIQGFINAQKDEGLRAKHIDAGGDFYLQTMVKAYTAYEEACERSSLVDFAELLLRAHELWLNQPTLLKHYQNRFRHILVDEFQDTNTVQYAWLRVLAGTQIPVMAVGDDDQSIYGWRGAKIENIQRFSQDFSDTQTIRLEQNYRSTQTILKAANGVIDNNFGRLGKDLWTEGDEGEKIDLYAGFNEHDEARFIVDRIDAWHRDGNPRASVAVLYRSNAQSRVLEEAFLRADIPYRIYGGQRFYERLEIRNALSYMRLVHNRNDDAAFERVINTPTRGIGAKTIETLRAVARDHSQSLWQSAIQLCGSGLPARASSALQGFLSLIETLDGQTDGLALGELTDHVVERSGLIAFHQKEKGERGQARVENLQELVVAAGQFRADDESITPLQQFLDNAALDAGEGQAEDFEDSVQLMTLHSAKGLEFPLVFLAGMEEGLFPHQMSSQDPTRLEEERRLCYVGITRAMQKLVLTYAETRRMHGSENYNAISRFVREIPDTCLQEVRLQSTVTQPVSRVTQNVAVPDANVSLGQRVYHQIFGEGMVVNFEGRGSHARVEVNFDTEGTKWLVLHYANLQSI